MLYKFAKGLFFLYFTLLKRVIISGSENIPDSGGIIICSNHINWLDPILLGSYIKRKIHFMAKAELFKSKFFAIILKGINAFPVKRGTGDIAAIKTSLKVIKDGEALGIFPEGTRSKNGKLLPAEPGVAMISVKTGAPVVPIRISGSYLLFKKISITIGKPISFSQYEGKKLSMDEMDKLSQTIMKEIELLG